MSKLRQAMGLDKEARGWTEAHNDAHIKRRWAGLSNEVETRGVMVGGNRRIIVPHRVLSEHDIQHRLGFVPVKVAVPEAGQTALRSFRHPDNNFHIHEHGDNWAIHYDKHPSTTMLMHKLRQEAGNGGLTVAGALKGTAAVAGATIGGMPHLIGEGVPGMGYYLAGQVARVPGMVDRVMPHLPEDYKKRIERLAPTRSPAPVAPAAPAPEAPMKEASVFWAAVGTKIAGDKSHDYYMKSRARLLQAATRYRAQHRDQIARKARAYRKQVAVGSKHVRSRTTNGNRYVFGNYK